MSNDKKPEVKTEKTEMQKAIMEGVSEAIKETLPIATMAAAQALKASTVPPPPQRGQAPVSHGPRCTTCGQYLTACEDKHVELYVGPQNPRRVKDFPGVFINSIQYISPPTGQRIPVPEVAASGIMYTIREWEEGEEDLRTGRVITHNSGVLSGAPGRSNTTPFGGAGFRG